MSEKIALIDLDFVKYSIASVGEERYVDVIHKSTKKKREFSTKTEFYGRNTQGGWLSELNEKRSNKGLSTYDPDEFEIIQKQRVTEPLEFILYSAKTMIESVLKKSEATSYEYFIGKGNSFRTNISTLLEYKGNRKDLLKPLLLDDVNDYLTDKFDANIVTNLEADDALVIRCIELLEQGKDAFIIGVDKDYKGCPVKFFNANNPEEGVRDCRGFGELWIDESKKNKKVDGYGRLFKYFQICSQDLSDNYKANAHSDVRWGEMSAHKALKDCESDQGAYGVMVDIFNKLYPESKKIKTWSGDEIEIDALYCLDECFRMAHLLEKPDEYHNILTYMKSLGVKT